MLRFDFFYAIITEIDYQGFEARDRYFQVGGTIFKVRAVGIHPYPILTGKGRFCSIGDIISFEGGVFGCHEHFYQSGVDIILILYLIKFIQVAGCRVGEIFFKTLHSQPFLRRKGGSGKQHQHDQ